MKLATLKAGGRDGTLLVVNQTLTQAVTVPDIAPTLQAALDDWNHTSPRLAQVSADLNSGRIASQPLDCEALAAPLPRAWSSSDPMGGRAASSFRSSRQRSRLRRR